MVNKEDVQQIDALDQWCLQRILDIRWHNFVMNDGASRKRQHHPLCCVVNSHQFSLSGHVTQMNEMADANWILSVQPPDNWRRPKGRPCSTWIWNVCNDLSSFSMELPEAREAAHSRPFWRMLTKHS